VTVEYVLFATIMRMVEHQSAKFSVFSLVIREFDHGDWFASDCTIRVANIELVDSPPRALHADGGAVEAENAVLGRVRRRGLNTITTRMRL
jgi:hypothetical protein